jgi:2-methylcitrate dehydratase PrpD
MARGESSSYSEQLADFVSNLKFSAIPQKVVDKMKLHFIDSIGLALAGVKEAPARQVILLAEALGGPPESSIIGSLKKIAAPNAVMANSGMLHAMDFDDTHLGAHAHISSFIIPTALAVAEQFRQSGKALIEAAVAGAEVACRIGLACRESPNDRGIHTTCFISPLGAAVVAGKLMGLDRNGQTTALGIAGSMSCGLLQTQVDGTTLKSFHPAWGSHGGILAVRLVGVGFTGPRHVFEGVYGLYNAFFGPDAYDPNKLIGGLGQVWETNNIAFKFYPGGHGIHHFLDSVRDLRQKGIKTDDIEKITLMVNEFRKNAHFEPPEIKYAPPTGYIARFSMPYMIARMMLDGELGPNSYDADKLVQRDVLEFAKKVTYEVKPGAMDMGKEGTVVVKKRDGSTFEYRASGIRGTPQRPAEPKDIREKFMRNATRSLSKERAEEILKMLEHLEDMADITDLIKALKV